MQDSLSKSKSPVNVSGNYSSMNIQENPIFSSSNSLERRSKSNSIENLLSKLILIHIQVTIEMNTLFKSISTTRRIYRHI